MKKHLALLLALVILAGCLLGCTAAEKTEKISVVTTVFPIYDWVKQLADDEVEVTMLLDNGVDLHSYQPTAADLVKLAQCDLFIYIGGESDEWVEDALQNAHPATLNLLESLGSAAKTETLLEGMEGEAEDVPDEHIWLSLRNAAVLVPVIAEALNGIGVQADASAYLQKLKALDADYQTAVDGGSRKTLLFADRFPFRYLADDYGLTCYAAFSGCSAESEASFETVAFLAQKVDELQLPAVLTLEGSDQKLAQTVIDATQQKSAKILTLDSLQSTTSKDGVTYLSAMEKNLSVLKEALQ